MSAALSYLVPIAFPTTLIVIVIHINIVHLREAGRRSNHAILDSISDFSQILRAADQIRIVLGSTAE